MSVCNSHWVHEKLEDWSGGRVHSLSPRSDDQMIWSQIWFLGTHGAQFKVKKVRLGVLLCSINKSLHRGPHRRGLDVKSNTSCPREGTTVETGCTHVSSYHTFPRCSFTDALSHYYIHSLPTLAKEQGKYAAARLCLPEWLLWQRKLPPFNCVSL